MTNEKVDRRAGSAPALLMRSTSLTAHSKRISSRTCARPEVMICNQNTTRSEVCVVSRFNVRKLMEGLIPCFRNPPDPTIMRKVVFFTLILFCIDSTFAVSHSLQYVYSGTSEIPNLPEFVVIGLVDGEPFVHYDSNSHKMTPRQEWMARSEGPDYWNKESQNLHGEESLFKNNVDVAKKPQLWKMKNCEKSSVENKWVVLNFYMHNKITESYFEVASVHTFQRMYSCDWDDETGATGAHEQFGYDGSDFLALDLKTMTYVAPVMQAIPTKQKWDRDNTRKDRYKRYFTQECIDWLKKYVSYGKSTLERTVRPEVSLLQKDPSSPVICHATGFFPKGIVVTWRKDGVDMHSDVEVGETLPNGDGTFQITSKLMVKPEDWKRNSYSCVVQHSQKDLPVLLEEKNIRTNQGGLPWGIIIGCVAAALALVAVVVGVVLWRRSRTGYGKAGTSYTDSENSSQQQPKVHPP
nr:class I histocompatibility antigen, F10 alpha chain-like [Paramormyrops kingsleyae]